MNRDLSSPRPWACWCLIAAMLAPSAWSQRSDTRAALTSSAPEAAADLTTEGMTRRLAELRPEVEAAIGAPLGAAIAVHRVSGTELAAVAADELFLVCTDLPAFRQTSRTRTTGLFEATLSVASAPLLWTVDLATNELFVAPGNFRLAARDAETDAIAASRDALDAVLISGMARVWLGRNWNVPRFVAGLQNWGALPAREAVVAGFSRHVLRQVAHVRQSGRLLDVLDRLNAQLRALAARVKTEFAEEREYVWPLDVTAGERLVATVAAKAGLKAALDRILAAPPRELKELGDPAPWLDGPNDPAASRPAGAVPVPADAHPESRALVHLQGRIVSLAGVLPTPVKVRVWCGGPDRAVRTVDVRDGRFEATGAWGPGAIVSTVFLGEERLVFGAQIGESGAVPDLQIVLRGAPTTLQVRDAVDGHLLADAEARPWPEDVVRNPPPAASSEVAFEFPWASVASDDGLIRSQFGDEPLLVTAPGHGWALIDRHSVPPGRPYEVRLPRGGDVRVRIPAGSMASDLSLVATQRVPVAGATTGARIASAALDADGFAALYGIPTGDWDLVVRRGDAREGEVIASVPFSIQSGRTTDLTVELRLGSGAADRVLTLRAPASWTSPVVSAMQIYSAGQAHPLINARMRVGGKELATDVTVRALTPGRYTLCFPDILWETTLSVDEATRLVVTLPDIGRVTVEPSDRETSIAVERSYVEIRRPGAAESRGARPELVIGMENRKRGWAVTAGRCEVTVIAPHQLKARGAADVRAGETATAHIPMEAGGDLELKVETKRPEGVEHLWLVFEFGGRELHLQDWRTQYVGFAPGTYELRCVRAESCERPSSRQVVVKPRETTTVTIAIDEVK